jgi:peroxiredoxin
MAVTPSTMLPLGTPAPDVELADVVSGRMFGLGSFSEKVLLVVFVCQHCPYVQHIKGELSRLGHNYAGHDLAMVAISSNDAAQYPLDAPAELKKFAETERFPFPLLYDESQAAAKAFTAACTPDFFLFDASRRLVYRGQLDDSRPGNGKPVTGKDLRAAIDCVLEGKPVGPDQRPATGCNIKWRPGNEPPYFK